jgi:uncharacterized protein YukJ
MEGEDENLTHHKMSQRVRKFTNITTNATTAVNGNKQTHLERIVINTKGATANTATVYNGPAADADPIGDIDTTAELKHLDYGVDCPNGVYVVTASGTAADLTVVWS